MGRHIVRYKLNNSIIPSEYTQLYYIEGTGTQYIDTGLQLSINDTIYIKYSFSNGTCAYGTIFGSQAGAAEAILRRNNDSLNLQTWRLSYTEDSPDKPTDIEWGRVVESKLKSELGSAFNIYLFTSNRQGSPSYTSRSKIYQYKVYRNSDYIINLIPAQRILDNAIGMYDTVSGTFFTNSGTDNFIAGPEIGNVARGLVVSREGEAPPSMPEGYTAVKAIKSNGSQYFQTSWIPDFTKDIIIDGDVGFVTITRGMWFANYGSTGQTFSVELYNNFYLRFFCDSDVINTSTGIGFPNTLAHVTYNYTASTGALTLSCSTGATGSGTIPSGRRVKHTSTVWFGTDNFSGHRFPFGYFGKLKITEGGVDVIDYQPCMNSEGVYGMYDYVTETFYPSTTGTGFLLGEDYVATLGTRAIKTKEANN